MYKLFTYVMLGVLFAAPSYALEATAPLTATDGTVSVSCSSTEYLGVKAGGTAVECLKGVTWDASNLDVAYDTDSQSAALAAAIATVNAAGGGVLRITGEVRIQSSVAMKSNVTLEGLDQGTIKAQTNFTGGMLVLSNTADNYIGVRNLTFDLDGKTVEKGIYFQGTGNGYVVTGNRFTAAKSGTATTNTTYIHVTAGEAWNAGYCAAGTISDGLACNNSSSVPGKMCTVSSSVAICGGNPSGQSDFRCTTTQASNQIRATGGKLCSTASADTAFFTGTACGKDNTCTGLAFGGTFSGFLAYLTNPELTSAPGFEIDGNKISGANFDTANEVGILATGKGVVSNNVVSGIDGVGISAPGMFATGGPVVTGNIVSSTINMDYGIQAGGVTNNNRVVFDNTTNSTNGTGIRDIAAAFSGTPIISNNYVSLASSVAGGNPSGCGATGDALCAAFKAKGISAEMSAPSIFGNTVAISNTGGNFDPVAYSIRSAATKLDGNRSSCSTSLSGTNISADKAGKIVGHSGSSCANGVISVYTPPPNVRITGSEFMYLGVLGIYARTGWHLTGNVINWLVDGATGIKISSTHSMINGNSTHCDNGTGSQGNCRSVVFDYNSGDLAVISFTGNQILASGPGQTYPAIDISMAPGSGTFKGLTITGNSATLKAGGTFIKYPATGSLASLTDQEIGYNSVIGTGTTYINRWLPSMGSRADKVLYETELFGDGSDGALTLDATTGAQCAAYDTVDTGSSSSPLEICTPGSTATDLALTNVCACVLRENSLQGMDKTAWQGLTFPAALADGVSAKYNLTSFTLAKYHRLSLKRSTDRQVLAAPSGKLIGGNMWFKVLGDVSIQGSLDGSLAGGYGGVGSASSTSATDGLGGCATALAKGGKGGTSLAAASDTAMGGTGTFAGTPANTSAVCKNTGGTLNKFCLVDYVVTPSFETSFAGAGGQKNGGATVGSGSGCQSLVPTAQSPIVWYGAASGGGGYLDGTNNISYSSDGGGSGGAGLIMQVKGDFAVTGFGKILLYGGDGDKCAGGGGGGSFYLGLKGTYSGAGGNNDPTYGTDGSINLSGGAGGPAPNVSATCLGGKGGTGAFIKVDYNY